MADRKQRIIITGAAGFIGSALAWRLNQLGYSNLLLVDELDTSSKWKNLVPLSFKDYLDKTEFLDLITTGKLDREGIGAVLHMGACSSTTEMDVGYLAKNNFLYSKTLATWCLENIRPIRFIYASSAATYGDGRQGYHDDHSVLNSLRPLNPYGYSKHIFDLWNLERGYLDRAVGLKFFNVFGPNEYHKEEMRSMVAKAFDQIKEKGTVRLFKSHHPDYKDGMQVRDFLYIKDAVDMTLFFLEGTQAGGIYNIGTGKTHTWLDLVTALFSTMEKSRNVEFIPMPEIIRDKYQYHTQAEISKLRALGYQLPNLTLKASVQDYARYLEAGCKNLGWE